MRVVSSLFAVLAGVAFVLAMALHVLAVLDVFLAGSALLDSLFWGMFIVAAPLLFYDKARRARASVPLSWGLIRGLPLVLLVGLGVLLAYVMWFHAHNGGPTRWSIPADPVPPLIVQLTTLVEAWMFACFGALHYVELRRVPATPF